MNRATVIIPTLNGEGRLGRLLSSLDNDAPILVIDNASSDGTRALLSSSFPDVDVMTLARNEGFSRAVNLAVQQIETDSFVLLNDDCVCEPGFVPRIVEALDPARAVVMAAGIMLERSDPRTIDSAGIELDETLLVFDYLNGEPVEAVQQAPAPVGPSGAAAAFNRSAFLDVGGFDEMLFAYWEDVDLALRLRLLGAECALVPGARAYHTLSATLGSGSSHKNYLTGFGRGYMLRKWSVLQARRAVKVLARDGLICAGQAIFDRNVTGVCGRVEGWRAGGSAASFQYPERLFRPYTLGLWAEMSRRRARRGRIARADIDN